MNDYARKKMFKRFWIDFKLNTTNLTIFIFLLFAYVGRPLPLPNVAEQEIFFMTGKPIVTKLVPTKSSGSGEIFQVANTNFYCGIGITQGENNCTFFEDLINKKREVTVHYFFMPTRLGNKYPVVLSIEQDGMQKVGPNLFLKSLGTSQVSAWRKYYLLLSLFGGVAALLFMVEKLKKVSNLRESLK